MVCERCGVNDEKYFFEGVCRLCIGLRSELPEPDRAVGVAHLSLDFSLTAYQLAVSKQLCEWVEAGHSVYLNAVCGAGKTEMCLSMIERLIHSGLKIGWAIPRRQIVVELQSRLSDYFPGLKVVGVYGGHCDDLWGDLIVCTTHQLYRYHSYFDVLILDEPDAFPYDGNRQLEHLMKASVRGPIVYLSATYELKDEMVKRISLDLRPSERLLPVPVCSYSFMDLLRCLWRWRLKPVLVFVPSRAMARRWAFFLRCNYLCSSSEDKEDVISDFRSNGGFLVCTTVLERGVTFYDCFVIVVRADHVVFSESSLVQIAGRVQRGMFPKEGDVFFWSRYRSEGVKKSFLRIMAHNVSAQSVLKKFRNN